jgi:hypothetical protein
MNLPRRENLKSQNLNDLPKDRLQSLTNKQTTNFSSVL